MNRTLLIVTIAYWLTIFTLTHIPQQHLPSVPFGDKIEHLLAYGLLGLLLYCYIWRTRPHLNNIEGLVLTIGLLYGAIDELLQAVPFIHRSCELLDWFADCTGIAIAVGVLSMLRWRIKAR